MSEKKTEFGQSLEISLFSLCFIPEITVLCLFLQNAIPCRMKSLHMYNEPAFFDAIFALFSPLMKQKTKDRVRYKNKYIVILVYKISRR